MSIRFLKHIANYRISFLST